VPLREVVGDIWLFDCTVRVIPTNGFVKNNGRAVMGAGLALQAAKRFPDLPVVLGRCIDSSGNHVHVIRHDIVAFPTKHNWWEKSDLKLIEQSAEELRALAETQGWRLVALPRVGTGNGQLRWAEVKPILNRVLAHGAVFVVVDNS